jgi:beta-glucosidase
MNTLAVPRAGIRLRFPAGFWWGASTAAYQIEGSTDADGRVPSIWDTFAAAPGRIENGDTGSTACDHYSRYRDDVRLMAELGLTAYRFSVAWPRVMPDPDGQLDHRGLDFYDRLVDELLAAGIRPTATLYHWDLPQTIEDRGGWAARETVSRFSAYAAAVANRLGDRVAMWNTLNEPWCSAFLGYGAGVHAPGRTSYADALAATHHLLLAHGRAADILRARCPSAEVSIALNAGTVRPATDTDADRDAARMIDGMLNRVFFDPLLRGSYPADVIDDTAWVSDWSFVRDGDLAEISQPLDAIGVNYYQPDVVAAGPGPSLPYPTRGRVSWKPMNGPVTGMGWAVDPSGLHEMLVRITRDYGSMPLYVTENGAAFDDAVTNGRVHDPARISFLKAHFEAAHRALADGVDLRGYFVWSLLDNFEWAFGYGKRFGLIRVDYESQERTPKDSAFWYRDVIARGGF